VSSICIELGWPYNLYLVMRLRQIVGALFIIGWNIVWTSLILLFIKFVLRVPLRMSDADLLIGDDAIHGVSQYTFNQLFADVSFACLV
jgi:Amt family ammonium transporter